ncbi:thiosulfate sulfurtransferas-like protein [Eremomyces bilateralis CBS 781.70]|uniref:Thiosulfate sulfurtransferas-like protein n=1 Tax=Eremomyces bilateralis CBS 781.70 TaxID=1392243 RepID=A0A6G1FXD0_9PEZI|nr:thiosulfate sulfurtransferas-like protein [Eremomyces bilateralis CBS 781.70]KAF1810443.1 thiosulfate sulfurtransferas-like protein [Eremomyces bilateralis CBS 781.70]
MVLTTKSRLALRAWNVGFVTRRTIAQYALPRYLVTPDELHTALQKNVPTRISTAPRIIPLCASWFLPNDPEKRTGHSTFITSRIPQSRFFDLDAIKDRQSPYPHMLPTPTAFADAMGKLGIRRDDSLVVYDTKELGIFSAPRVAWTLRVFGHSNVHILNNFRLWVELGYPLDKGEPAPVDETDYRPVPDLDASKVATFEEIHERILEKGKEGAEEVQILDARSTGRWEGKDPEPREGLSSGHIPRSSSIPFSSVLDPTTKTFLPSSELRALFKEKGVDPSKAIINSCGTGVSAAVLDAALAEAGFADEGRRLYDGSWTEWAQRVKPEENLIHKKA